MLDNLEAKGMSTSPRIHFYGGILTIGGTKVVVEEDGYRVIFDFGSTYAPGGDFWGRGLEPRPGAARLRDLIGLGYTPALNGLYRAGYAQAAGLTPGVGDGKTQVFISHLHLDHMAIVDLLAGEIPVWMHNDSLRLFRAVATTGEKPAVPQGARGFEWGQTIEVGPIKVTPVAVDHDIPGASALLIETSAGTVVYTGDLRTHGANPERVEAFIAAAREKHPKMLLIEGTRLGELANPDPDRPPTLKETEVPGRVVEYLKRYAGLGLITLYPRNTLRIGNIARAVKAEGRQMVLSAEMAHVYAALDGDLNDVALYLRARDREALEAGTAEAYLTDLLKTGVKTVDAATIRADQSRYLLQLYYWDFGELNDLQPGPGSVFIHSNGEPLGKFDPAFELFQRWLGHFGVELVYASSTGHADPASLQRMVAEIQPVLLMPIHSHFPQLLEVASVNRELPELGGIYEIATGKRVG
jgi:ribonuclease J